MKIDTQLILRIGLAIILFWFGGSQVLEPSNWTFFLPEWLVGISPISPELIVLLNGGVEIVLGAFILFGIFLRVSAAIVALHLFGIAFSLGNTPSGIRDVGLAFMALALVFKK
ncbi:MAG: DoxX family membrane protein [Patescibacteria group bacterium UBA2103]